MKTYIWCKLFGHKFKVVSVTNFMGAHIHKEAIDMCVKCGLSKEELNIKK